MLREEQTIDHFPVPHVVTFDFFVYLLKTSTEKFVSFIYELHKKY
ncbi:hypothetical protein [Enterococcus sp. DIV2417]